MINNLMFLPCFLISFFFSLLLLSLFRRLFYGTWIRNRDGRRRPQRVLDPFQKLLRCTFVQIEADLVGHQDVGFGAQF